MLNTAGFIDIKKRKAQPNSCYKKLLKFLLMIQCGIPKVSEGEKEKIEIYTLFKK